MQSLKNFAVVISPVFFVALPALLLNMGDTLQMMKSINQSVVLQLAFRAASSEHMSAVCFILCLYHLYSCLRLYARPIRFQCHTGVCRRLGVVGIKK